MDTSGHEPNTVTCTLRSWPAGPALVSSRCRPAICSPPRQGVLLTYSSLYSCPYWLPVLTYLMLGECWRCPRR